VKRVISNSDETMTADQSQRGKWRQFNPTDTKCKIL